jgi:hypothetical protein
MSDRSHLSVYQHLQDFLAKLKESLRNGNLVRQDQEIDGLCSELLNLSDQEIDQEMVGKWRSLITELHRDLRLLKTHLLFLSTSKTPSHQAKNLKTVENELIRLNQGCESLLTLIDR